MWTWGGLDCSTTRSASLVGRRLIPAHPTLGGQNFGWSGWNDSIYRGISIPFVASSTTTSIRFYDGGLQGLSDESWGIDNVGVREQDIGLSGRILGHYQTGADQYQFSAQPGNRLFIYTTTPGDGPGEPAQTFDPYLQLYGPAGLLVALDDDGGPQNDDRNAGITYTVPEGAGGTYTIRVQGTGSGAYTVTINAPLARLARRLRSYPLCLPMGKGLPHRRRGWN